MVVRTMKLDDISQCADILCNVYNNEKWQCRWTKETAIEYLTDFFDMKKFVGYVLADGNEIIGAVFAHEKVWWNNSEIFIEEMFIRPNSQHNGYGSILMNKIEEYVKKHALAGITLSTNKYTFAPSFYRKNGFADCEHVIFMAKEY